MTHQNLVLTEEAVKNHCKRLKKILHKHNTDLSLCEVQNLFTETLGFNNFHELKQVLNNHRNDEHPFQKIINNFKDKRNNEQAFFVFIEPKEKISAQLQASLKAYIYSLELDYKEQKITIENIDINENSCIVYLDTESEFAILNKMNGITIDGCLSVLATNISHYLQDNNHQLFYHIEYGYKIKNDNRNVIKLEDLILKRE